MSGLHWKIGPDNDSASMFLGTSRARMSCMVRQNRVSSLAWVTDDYGDAEDCACEDAASDIYWGQVLAIAELKGKSLSELGLEIEDTDFETAAARFIAENGEDDFLRLERELPKEWRQSSVETSYELATSLHSRDRASVENRPVVMILDANLMWSRRNKLGVDDIHPLDDVLLGVVDVPLGIFALWKVQPMSGFFAERASHMFPFAGSPDNVAEHRPIDALVLRSITK
jgi:hypothetical protein